MSFFQEVYDRIRFATNARTQIELAAVLEIRQSSISDAKRRDSIPADWIMKLFEKYGLNPDWVKKGVGPMYLRTEQDYTPMEAPLTGVREEPAMFGDPLAKNIVASVFNPVCQYVEGEPTPELQAEGKIALPQSFAGSVITVVHAVSDAMAPTIRKGAYVGVDTTPTLPISGEVYALFMPHGGVAFKRVFFDEQQNAFILRADMPGHPEILLAPEHCATRVFGRVEWVLQRV